MKFRKLPAWAGHLLMQRVDAFPHSVEGDEAEDFPATARFYRVSELSLNRVLRASLPVGGAVAVALVDVRTQR